ncbi:MAG: UvrB/UvrC motif-containing protein [Clostridia bacterium]|nr:UvrB/UvrC motif-containing protein [Clostridia bacterium]MBQ3956231.1 UvrB/UvrC motif-containing protein [Clostridia bacterium]
MLCEKCRKNEATNFYHENVNGKVRSMRLCAECAKSLEESGDLPKLNADKFFEDFDFFDEPFFQNPVKTLNSLFSGFFGGEKALGSGNPSGEEKTAEKKCEGCGSTLRDFATRGAGCPKCFETFAEELAPTVSRAHGRTVHTGRAPAKFRDRIETKRKIEALVEEQREAVKNEDFERAAEIRDELKKLRAAEPNEAVEA